MLARLLPSVCWVIFSLLPALATAQEFRVETEVYADGAKEPVSESLTLFSGEVVYDFMLEPPGETTVFDIRRGRLVILDSSRQVKTTLSTDQLAQLSAAIKTLGTQQGSAGLFEPRFETTFDEEQLRVTLSSDRLTYAAKGVAAKHAEGAHRFRQFADWYARLNAIRPGNVPPFGRLELNQALADRGLLPVEIERTVTLERTLTNKTSRAQSKHAINWILSNTDRGRMDQAGRDLVKFEEVPPAAYWSASNLANLKP